MTLSDKIQLTGEIEHCLCRDDVKQFIKDLKKDIGNIPTTMDGTYYESITELIDKRAGEKLV